MLITYILFLVIGLVLFIVSYHYESRKNGEDHNAIISTKSDVSNPLASKKSSGTEASQELQDIKQALVDKLDQKCIKLEKILEEKNRILAQLQKDLEHERSHRTEFESLQSMMQHQIDDLKAQNKTLREEIGRVLDENLHLQTCMGEKS